MDSDLHSPSDSAGAKAAFHKPSNDPSNRKYRRRSPVSGSASSDEERIHERSSTPTYSLNNNSKVNDKSQRKDDRRDIDKDPKRSRYSRASDRNSDRRSYDDYKRREKYADEDHKHTHKSFSRSYRDHSRRDVEQNRSRDNFERHSHSRDRGHKSGHHHKDDSRDDSKYTRVEKGKSHDQRHFKEPKELLDEKSTLLPAKKSKFSEKETEYTKDASTVVNEIQSSSSKQGQDFVKESDIDAAKVAAMKAAELVNKNLIGTGIMSTDQKKKLLWGSKKTAPTEEAGHRWDTSMFSDRERQEKFNKLMGVKKVEQKQPESVAAENEKQKELQLDLEKQYTAGLRRRDGRTVGLGL